MIMSIIFAFDMVELRWKERFVVLLNVYFATFLSKNLQKSSVKKNNSEVSLNEVKNVLGMFVKFAWLWLELAGASNV